jgi:iron complex transport system ATP-binding protein
LPIATARGDVHVLGMWTRRAQGWTQSDVAQLGSTVPMLRLLIEVTEGRRLLGMIGMTHELTQRAMAEQALRSTQAWDWRERSMGTLSGGERQRVLLARALAVQAPVILFDEPLSHLDPPHQADWMDLTRALVAAGATVLSVLHEVSMALQADEMLMVHNGRLVHQGACADARTHRALEQVFDQRIAVHTLDGQALVLPRRAARASQQERA